MKSFLFISILIILSVYVTAQERNTNYFINGGARVNLNLHNSDFSKLTGIPNCCNNFSSTSGFGYTIFAGVEYLIKQDYLFGLKYSAELAFTDLSADYKVEEFIGNDLLENDYRQITVSHNLETSLSYLLVGQAIVFNPLNNFDLGIKLGFDIGFPITANFVQNETLLQPSDVFFRGGSKVRNEYSGALPDKQSIYFGVKAGVRYAVYKNKNLQISPEIEFNYALTNVTTSQNWSVNSVKAGIAVHFNIPKKDLQKPINPPSANPPFKEIQLSKDRLDIASKLSYKNLNISPNETIYVYRETEKFSTKEIMPLVFFYNKDEISPQQNQNLDIISNINNLVANNPDAEIKLVAYSMNESDIVLNQRLDNITKQIKSNSNIKKSIELINKKKVIRSELEDEYRKVEVIFNNEKYAINTHSEIKPNGNFVIKTKNINKKINSTEAEDTEFDLVFNIINDNDLNFYNVSTSTNNIKNELFSGNSLPRTANILQKPFKVNLLKDDYIELNSKFVDVSNIEAIQKNRFEITHIDTIANEYNNNKISENGAYQQFVVGYFEFDREQFNYIDKEAINYINKNVNSYSKVEIIAMTDNFGTEEYNVQLANKRAQAAIKLLTIDNTSLILINKNGGIYDNLNPYNRLLNRSVIIRVYN